MKIHVIDSIMGSGKTTFIINQINKNPKKRYIFVTQYLSEVERITSSCHNVEFFDPASIQGTKSKGLKCLIQKNKNIVTTHALFKQIDKKTIDLIKNSNYTLVLDEVMHITKTLSISSDDVKVFVNSGEIISDPHTGLVSWPNKYSGLFSDVKQMVSNNCVYLHGDNVLMWMVPIDLFLCFEEVYILTYMFDYQLLKYYFDIHSIAYEKINLDIPTPRSFHVNLVNGWKEKINWIGKEPFSLSMSWYMKNKDKIETMRKHINNFFKNYCQSKSEENLWTTYKAYQNALSSKGYTKAFLPLNTRAINQYSNRTNVAYTVNRFMPSITKSFLLSHGINIDENMFALSELIQFVWRSAIRNGEPINLYIPSKRMRDLFVQWFNTVSDDKIDYHETIQYKLGSIESCTQEGNMEDWET